MQNLISKTKRDFLMQVEKRYNELRGDRTCLDLDAQLAINVVLDKEFNRLPLTNEERSLIEVYDWYDNIPDAYFAYWQDNCRYGAKITNFMGEVLGRVIKRGTPYRMGQFSKKVRVLVCGTNGAVYKGTAELDDGTYIRMRLVKAHANRAGTQSPLLKQQMQEAS